LIHWRNRHSRHIQPHSGTEKAFGQALREIRKSRNLSQEQLALDSDFDRTYVSLLERGLQSPTVRTIVKLAATLDVLPSVMILRMERTLGLSSRRRAYESAERSKKL
jgi:transcriptional regulator with XRE-family HTH domain